MHRRCKGLIFQVKYENENQHFISYYCRVGTKIFSRKFCSVFFSGYILYVRSIVFPTLEMFFNKSFVTLAPKKIRCVWHFNHVRKNCGVCRKPLCFLFDKFCIPKIYWDSRKFCLVLHNFYLFIHKPMSSKITAQNMCLFLRKNCKFFFIKNFLPNFILYGTGIHGSGTGSFRHLGAHS